MVVWAIGAISSGPVQPSATYNGVAVNFPNSPAFNGGSNAAAPWIGYIINPPTGSHTFYSDYGANVAVFHNVDQSAPFSSHNQLAQYGLYGSSICYINTNFDYSVILKGSWDGQTNTNYIGLADASGETGGQLIVANATPRWSYKSSTTAGAYSVGCTWSIGQSEDSALQAVELKWSGPIYVNAATSVANSASRTVSASRTTTNYRAIIQTASYGAGRVMTAGKYVAEAISMSVANSASRLMTVAIRVKRGWLPAVRSAVSWASGSKSSSVFSTTNKSSASWTPANKSKVNH